MSNKETARELNVRNIYVYSIVVDDEEQNKKGTTTKSAFSKRVAQTYIHQTSLAHTHVALK